MECRDSERRFFQIFGSPSFWCCFQGINSTLVTLAGQIDLRDSLCVRDDEDGYVEFNDAGDDANIVEVDGSLLQGAASNDNNSMPSLAENPSNTNSRNNSPPAHARNKSDISNSVPSLSFKEFLAQQSRMLDEASGLESLDDDMHPREFMKILTEGTVCINAVIYYGSNLRRDVHSDIL